MAFKFIKHYCTACGYSTTFASRFKDHFLNEHAVYELIDSNRIKVYEQKDLMIG